MLGEFAGLLQIFLEVAEGSGAGAPPAFFSGQENVPQDLYVARAATETMKAPGPPSARPFYAVRLWGTRSEGGRTSTTTFVARQCGVGVRGLGVSTQKGEQPTISLTALMKKYPRSIYNFTQL